MNVNKAVFICLKRTVLRGHSEGCSHDGLVLRESEYDRGTGSGKTARPGLDRGRRIIGFPTARGASVIDIFPLLTVIAELAYSSTITTEDIVGDFHGGQLFLLNTGENIFNGSQLWGADPVDGFRFVVEEGPTA